jgi:hypothetical protein
MHVNEFIKRLKNVRKTSGGWQACCPGHEDHTPSLSIDASADGHILLKCHTGCTAEKIVAAIGLKMSDLMPAARVGAVKPADRRRPGRASEAAPGTSKRAQTFETMQDTIEAYNRVNGRHTDMWTYTDADDVPVGAVVRWDKTDGHKDIRPVALKGGKWVQAGMKDPAPLYRLGDLLRKPTDRVYVLEGEKAVEAARNLGLLATTSAGGSNASKKTDWEPLAGRDVVIFPDNDIPGRKYADDVLAHLHATKPPATVRILTLPELPPGGDIVEFVETRWSREISNEAIVAEIGKLADAVPPEQVTGVTPAAPQYEPFPDDVFPKAVSEFVRMAADSIGCDAGLIGVPLLSALAAAIGNTRRVQLKQGWTEPSILWTVIVGESGSHKSPAMEEAMRPVRARQQEAMKQYARAMLQYRQDLDAHELNSKQWKRSQAGSSPTAPVKPIADRYWTDDVTIEALVQRLSEQPRGLLLIRDELSGWLSGFDRYNKGGEVAKWLETHGGRGIIVDRKTSDTISVPRAAVSIAGGIQPEILRRALSPQYLENGLAARMLLACPPRRLRVWTENDLPGNVRLAMEAVFDRLYSLGFVAELQGDLIPGALLLDPGAKALFIKFFNEHGREHDALGGGLAAAWSKLEGYAARLAMVLHLTRWAAGDETVGDPQVIDDVSMKAGIKLARWFGNEAKRLYGMLAESGEEIVERHLTEHIVSQGGSISIRDLARWGSEYRAAGAAEAALERLVGSGIGRWEYEPQNPSGGQPAKRFCLNSVQAEDTTSPATIADQGSVIVAASADSQEEVGVI